MRLVVEIELDVSCSGQVQRNIRATGSGMQTVVHIPIPIEGGFVVPIPGGNIECPLPDIVVSIISQKRFATRRIPVAAASKFRLQVPGNGDRGLSEEAGVWMN